MKRTWELMKGCSWIATWHIYIYIYIYIYLLSPFPNIIRKSMFYYNIVKHTATATLDCTSKFVYAQMMKRTGPNAPNLLHRAYISICLTFPRFHVIVCKVETLQVFVQQRTTQRGLPLHWKGAVSLCLLSCLTPADRPTDDLSSCAISLVVSLLLCSFSATASDFELQSPANCFFSRGFW